MASTISFQARKFKVTAQNQAEVELGFGQQELRAHQPIHSKKVPSAMDSTLCPTMGLTSEPLKRPSRGPMTHAADRPATPPG